MLYYNQCPHCLAETIQQFPFVSLAAAPEVFKQVQKDIIAGFGEVVHPQLYEMYRENYHKAINSVLGNPKANEAYFDLAEKFKLNTARVAAYKSHYATSVLKDVYQTDPTRFPQKCDVLLKTFNRWQATEYNTATARIRTAKQWSQFQSEADLYPNLEWLATRSSTPRELHASFVGLILPQNDKFWENNQPGNLYNCKCDWRATDKAVNKLPDLETVKPAPGLDGNPATTGEVFSDKHPYYKKAANETDVENYYIKDVLTESRANIRNWAKENLINVVVKNVPEVGDVGFTVKGIKELLNQPHAQIISKNTALFDIENLLQTAVYIKSEVDLKAPEANLFHYLEVIIKNKKSWIILKETRHNKKINIYSIVDAIKKGN